MQKLVIKTSSQIMAEIEEHDNLGLPRPRPYTKSNVIAIKKIRRMLCIGSFYQQFCKWDCLSYILFGEKLT